MHKVWWSQRSKTVTRESQRQGLPRKQHVLTGCVAQPEKQEKEGEVVTVQPPKE